MFSKNEKQKISKTIEDVIKEINHPEMDNDNIKFTLHVSGKESWSWADISDNKSIVGNTTSSIWNENSRDFIKKLKNRQE